jgi:hypothetical protein
MFQDLLGPYAVNAISNSFDCNFLNLCGDDAQVAGLSAIAGLDLNLFNDFTFSVVSDRIVPYSSSVTGFTYEYNEDLDVYERSTSTFGPLFNERAQTLGKGRFLVGMSHSFLEFDEFNGQGTDKLSLNEDFGGALTLNEATFQAGGTSIQQQLQDQDLVGGIDMLLDLEIKEQVSTMYFTYGLADRIDIGLVVPLIRVEMDARVRPTLLGDVDELPNCDHPDLIAMPFPPMACLSPAFELGTRSDSQTESGIGDLLYRAKWQFLAGRTNAALLFTGTIPTGDPDKLTGLDDPIFIPGLVASRDFDTRLGGLGLQAYVGYEFRPDISDEEEVEWALGASLQPVGRASVNVDFLGSHETSGDDTVLDLAIGTKIMLSQSALLDLNFVMPLNDDGLRATGGIFTAQLEFVFGE